MVTPYWRLLCCLSPKGPTLLPSFFTPEHALCQYSDVVAPHRHPLHCAMQYAAVQYRHYSCLFQATVNHHACCCCALKRWGERVEG